MANNDELMINAIRTLSMDAVEKANSGHPGTPMALAPVAFTLWDKYIKHAPFDPDWPNRDRFILSAGHASMLLYSILYLMGRQVRRPSRIRQYPWHRMHDRASGTGSGHVGWIRHSRKVARGLF